MTNVPQFPTPSAVGNDLTNTFITYIVSPLHTDADKDSNGRKNVCKKNGGEETQTEKRDKKKNHRQYSYNKRRTNSRLLRSGKAVTTPYPKRSALPKSNDNAWTRAKQAKTSARAPRRTEIADTVRRHR